MRAARSRDNSGPSVERRQFQRPTTTTTGTSWLGCALPRSNAIAAVWSLTPGVVVVPLELPTSLLYARAQSSFPKRTSKLVVVVVVVLVEWKRGERAKKKREEETSASQKESSGTERNNQSPKALARARAFNPPPKRRSYFASAPARFPIYLHPSHSSSPLFLRAKYSGYRNRGGFGRAIHNPSSLSPPRAISLCVSIPLSSSLSILHLGHAETRAYAQYTYTHT